MTKTLILAAALGALVAPAGAAAKQDTAAGATLAIIGDTPYSDAQIANFHNDVDAINADAAVSRVVHLGDIKSGSTQCTDGYFASIRGQFDRFADPLVYTPGDDGSLPPLAPAVRRAPLSACRPTCSQTRRPPAMTRSSSAWAVRAHE